MARSDTATDAAPGEPQVAPMGAAPELFAEAEDGAGD
jgi:hypothetical protein